MDGRNQSFEIFCETATAFAPCMNDFLYVYDLLEDTYYISEHAVERFMLPGTMFHNVVEAHGIFTHPDDIDKLTEDLNLIVSGKKDFHNLIYRWIGRDGSPIWINCKGNVLKTEDGTPHLMVGCINEIGDKQQADNVSGLLGMSALHDYFTKLYPSLSDAMFLRIGVDDFKVINEKLGIEYGNFLIHEIAQCILSCLDLQQYAYRIVSDEFMILDLSGADYAAMRILYHRIRSAVDDLIEKEHYKALFTISAGLVNLKDLGSVDSAYSCYNEAMKFSEYALNEAKNRGKNQLYFFRPEDYTAFLRKRLIRSQLRRGLSNDFEGYDLYFQPIVLTNGGFLFAAEALLRFVTPTGDRISPTEFIPILEESGMIVPVGRWVLRKALEMCRQCREFHPDLMVSVNFSYIQLLKSPVYEDVTKALDEAGLPPSSLIVELTESGHLQNTPAIQSVWQKLRVLGVNIALDDFGTGYSNLINIGDLRPNIVKIDRSFTLKSAR